MKRVGIATCMLLAAEVASAAYCPPDSEQSGGTRDIMLLYAAPKRWPVEHLRPYVAYLDKQTGKAKDWFFDGWLFLMYGGAPSKQAYISGATNKGDWLYFLDTLWEPGWELDALDKCIAQVGSELGDRGKTYPVTLMIPYPSVKQSDFGDVDGDGQSENLSKPQGRIKAVRWFVDEALRRWRESHFAHLKLWGFYWMNEGISGRDHLIVQETSDHVHKRGYKMHWIPWHVAPGYDQCRELRLDFAVMQPNFAFVRPKAGLRLPNEDRLTINANAARAAGLGVEMELNGREIDSPESRWNLTQYLNHGVDELDGYMNGAARAWYQSYDYVRALYESDDPECSRLYDDVYRFHKGTYRRRVVSQAEGCPCVVKPAINAADAAKLTDGLWVTRGERTDRAVRVEAANVSIRVDLGTERLVDGVRVHLLGPSFPSAVRVSVARGDGALAFAGQTDQMPTHKLGHVLGGFAIVHFPGRVARWVDVQLLAPNAAQMTIDEIVIPPAGHLLWGIARQEADEGRRIKFDLPCVEYARLLRAHLAASGEPMTALINGQPLPAATRSATGWAEWPLDVAAVRTIELRSAGLGTVGCDDVQLLPPRNLALRKPYTLDPPFPQQYPDEAHELTDGQLCEKGFGDGRTVGWMQASPEVTLDLGGEKAVDRVRVHAQGGGQAWVNFPSQITVSGRTAGGLWARLVAGAPEPLLTAQREAGREHMKLGWMELPVAAAPARFVRLRFDTVGWTMLSEIQVMSQGRNVAAGASYSLLPQPASSAKYADNDGLLTDGVYTKMSMWRGCAGWNKTDPTITVDLEELRRIRAVCVRLIGGGAGAAYFPQSVSFAASVDGQTWQKLGVATERPEEQGKTVAAGSMGVRLAAPVTARLIRIQPKRRGWVMVNEVEVYGSAGSE